MPDSYQSSQLLLFLSIRKLKTQMILGLVLFLISISAAIGAEIGVARVSEYRTSSGVMIEGEIVSGDFEKFESAVLKREVADPVWLASPGGDIEEAIKIGRLVRELKLSVWVPNKSGLLFPMVQKTVETQFAPVPAFSSTLLAYNVVGTSSEYTDLIILRKRIQR